MSDELSKEKLSTLSIHEKHRLRYYQVCYNMINELTIQMKDFKSIHNIILNFLQPNNLIQIQVVEIKQ